MYNDYGYDMFGGYPSQMPSYQQYAQRRQQTQPVDAVIRVNGIEGAKMYRMPENSKVPLFDSNEDVFYIKSTDGAGFPEMKAYAFHEIPLDKPRAEYVTRDEFDQYKGMFDQLKEMLSSAQQPVRKPKPVYAETDEADVT